MNLNFRIFGHFRHFKINSKQISQNKKELDENALNLFQTHFLNQPLRKCYTDKFITRSIFQAYFIKLDFLEHLSICGKLRTLLIDVGWKSVLTLKESLYLTLVKMCYSNMLIASNTTIRHRIE